MSQTLFDNLYDTSDESSVPQSPSISSKPKSSGFSKPGDKITKNERSSESPEVKEKRKRERKERKEMKNEEKERKEKEAKSKYSTETPEEKAQRRKDKKERKKKGSKVPKEDDKAKQEQNLNIAEKVQFGSLGSLNATQATDIGSDSSDDDSTNASVMMDLYFGRKVKSNRQYQQEELDGSLTDDCASHSTEETILPNEKENLMRMEEVESENRQLNEMKTAYNAQSKQQLAYREELDAVQEELAQLRHERDNLIHIAGELTIESGNYLAEASESRDRAAECKVVIEQLRTLLQSSMKQQCSSASLCDVSKKMDLRSSMSRFSGLPISMGFSKLLGSLWGFRNKDDDKTVMSTYGSCDDDCMLDPTEDNTSVASEEDVFDLDLEQTEFAEQPSVAFFTDNDSCSTAQLYNRRLLKMNLILDQSRNKQEKSVHCYL